MKNQIAVLIILIFTTKIYAQDIIIKNVNLITMTTDRLIINQSLLIRNGKINQIGDFSKLSKNNQTTIINGKGKYVMPGLADMHVHLPEEDKIEKLRNYSTRQLEELALLTEEERVVRLPIIEEELDGILGQFALRYDQETKDLLDKYKIDYTETEHGIGYQKVRY